MSKKKRGRPKSNMKPWRDFGKEVFFPVKKRAKRKTPLEKLITLFVGE